MLRKILASSAVSFVTVIAVSISAAVNAETPAAEAVVTVAQSQDSAGMSRSPAKATIGAIGASALAPAADSDAVSESVDCFFAANVNTPACRKTTAGTR